MNKKDSAAFMLEKGKLLNETVIAYENEFLAQHKGMFVGDVISLKMEKEAKEILARENIVSHPTMRSAVEEAVRLAKK